MLEYDVVRTTGTGADIQAQLTLAKAAGGGRVVVPGGTWLLNTPLKISSYTWLICAPTTIINRNAAIDNLIRNDSGGTVGGYRANTTIRITGGIWQGNKAAWPTPATLIAFGHSTNILIEYADVSGTPGGWHGIEINSTSHATVSRCVLHDDPAGHEMLQIDMPTSTSSFPYFGPFDNTPCDDVTVEQCTFRDGRQGVGSHLSRAGVWHTNISILNNTFLNLTNDAIACQDYRDVLVQGNHFTNVHVGVHAFSAVNQVCDNFRVVANMFSAMTSRATTFNGGSTTERNIRQVSFVGNVVDGSASYGLTADYAKGVTYADNIVRNCGGFGIWIWKQVEVSLTGNRLIDNNTIGSATSGDLGVGGNAQATVGETSDVTVTGNTMGDVYVLSLIHI